MAKLIKMFKPGKHVAADGKIYEFTEADLKATAAAYNPVLHAAPLVIGHPKFEDVKYGQIQRLEFTDGFLQGEPANVDPAFAEEVNSGKRDRVSTSFYSPTSPGNPVPGVLYPRHLGFLGAAPPGCKGLGAVSFAEGEEGVIDFGDWNDRTIAGMFRGLKNLLIEKFGQESADKALGEWDLQAVTEDAATPDMKPGTCSCCGNSCADCTCDDTSTDFGESTQGGAMKLTEAQLSEKDLDLKRREAALLLKENSGKSAGNLAFAEGLVKEGKLLAVNKAALVAVLDFVDGVITGDTIEFGEGDAKKTEAPAKILKQLFGSYPKLIEFGELFSEEDPAKPAGAIPRDIAKYV
jgi:hypothetical protein